MAATPQYGTFIFKGQSGKTYSKDVYVSDVNAALVNIDGGAGASSTSPQTWTVPENVILVDYSQVTGTADTTKIQPTINGIPTGDMLRYTIHLTSLNNRPSLRIFVPKGAQFTAIQRT